ncbi:MAG: DUF1761 domain-containing protein [Pseudomonadota bacterium]
MSYLSVFLAALAGYGMGAIWYMTLAKPWLAAVGKTQEEVQSNRNPLPFIIAFICNLVVAGMMSHVFSSGGITGLTSGLISGLGAGMCLAAPWIITNYAFADRPKPLWFIDVGHTILACTAIGTVLGLFM